MKNNIVDLGIHREKNERLADDDKILVCECGEDLFMIREDIAFFCAGCGVKVAALQGIEVVHDFDEEED